jgi:hypothetical protein
MSTIGWKAIENSNSSSAPLRHPAHGDFEAFVTLLLLQRNLKKPLDAVPHCDPPI